MYRDLTIENFRSLRRIELQDLRRLNLLVGPNNVGKTSVLESMFLHACGAHLQAFLSIPLKQRAGRFRGPEDLMELLGQLFHNDSGERTLHLSARMSEGDRTAVTRSFTHSLTALTWDFSGQSLIEPPQGGLTEPSMLDEGELVDDEEERPAARPIARWTVKKDEQQARVLRIDVRGFVKPAAAPVLQSAVWLDPSFHRARQVVLRRFVRILRAERLPELLQQIQLVFPELVSIEQIPFSDGQAGNLFLRRSDGKKMEISSFGDGMRRWVSLLIFLVSADASLYCMDDIDAALHPYLEQRITSHLLSYLQDRDQQIVASTHNLEFIDALLRAAHESGQLRDEDTDPIAIYTMSRDKSGAHRLRRRSGREAYEAREEVHAELRA